MTRYIYTGPPSGFTVKKPDGGYTEIRLCTGKTAELDPTHSQVKSLIARGLLMPVKCDVKASEQEYLPQNIVPETEDPIQEPETEAEEVESATEEAEAETATKRNRRRNNV